MSTIARGAWRRLLGIAWWRQVVGTTTATILMWDSGTTTHDLRHRVQSNARDEPLAGQRVESISLASIGGPQWEETRPPAAVTIHPSPRDSVCCDPLLRRLLAWWRWCIVGLLGEAQVRAPSSGPWRCTVCAAATSHVVGQVHGRSEITASCGT